MPTPTPVPSSQIVQAVQASQNIIDNAVQQGIVGVLLLIAIAVVLFALGYAINAYARRNNRPDNTGTNNLIESQSETLKELREEFKQERIEWRKLIDKQNDNFTEAVQHLGDGYNRMVDVQDKQVALETSINNERRSDFATITALKADVGQMVNVGSIPLRKLIENVDGYSKTIIEKVDGIEKLLNEIKTNLLPCPEIQTMSESDRKLYTDVLEALHTDAELLRTSMQSHIADVRATDTGGMKPIQVEIVSTPQALPTPSETTN